MKTKKQSSSRSESMKGNQNALKCGQYTKEQFELQRLYRKLMKQSKQTLQEVDNEG